MVDLNNSVLHSDSWLFPADHVGGLLGIFFRIFFVASTNNQNYVHQVSQVATTRFESLGRGKTVQLRLWEGGLEFESEVGLCTEKQSWETPWDPILRNRCGSLQKWGYCSPLWQDREAADGTIGCGFPARGTPRPTECCPGDRKLHQSRPVSMGHELVWQNCAGWLRCVHVG